MSKVFSLAIQKLYTVILSSKDLFFHYRQFFSSPGKPRSVIVFHLSIVSILISVATAANADTPVSSTPIFTAEGEVGYATSALGLSTGNSVDGSCVRDNLGNLVLILPTGASVRQAYLYWATDGEDNQVNFLGNVVTADMTWSAQLLTSGYTGNRADVTSFISTTGSYQFSGLDSNQETPFRAGCLRGAQLIVVYDLPIGTPNALNRVDIFDGFQGMRGSGLAASTFAEVTLPISLLGSPRIVGTTLAWQGNATSEDPTLTDLLLVNGTAFGGNDANDSSGANKDNTTDFNGPVFGIPLSQYAVDTDTFDLTAIASGDPSITFRNESVDNDFLISQGFVLGYESGYDASDAPSATYGLARHITTGSSLLLGSIVDNELTLPDHGNADATLDDLTGVDDEDGISLPTFTRGSTLPITATVSGTGGFLQGWIDWNGNGSFEAGEQVATNVQDGGADDNNAATGTITFDVTVPITATLGDTIARFRWSSVQNLSSSDANDASIPPDGEVEDYRVTISALSISGNVFNDANGLTDGDVDGTGIGTPGGTQVFATLLDTSGNVVASVPVNANGTYTFDNVAANTDFTVQVSITDESGNAGGTPSTGPELPTGWVNTGEDCCDGVGDDGSVDGLVPVSVGTTNVTDANFGIEQPPSANDVSSLSQPNPGGTTQVPVPALDVSDPEDGTPTTIVIETLPNPATEGTLFYNGTPVTAGQVIPNFNPTLLTLDPVDGNPTVDFTYSTIDAAGEQSAPATVTMPFAVGLSINGNVFNDADGLTDGDVDGTGIGTPSGTQVYATLLDSSGNVVESVPVESNGTYSFTNVTANTDYTVQVSTIDESGNVGGTPSTGPALPAGWVNTGEDCCDGIGDDGSVDGRVPVSVGTTPVTDANFGIEQPPVANDVTALSQTNPGGTTQVPVPALIVSDPEDGTPSTIVIETLPNPATEGTLFYNGTAVTAGQVIPNFNPTLLTLDPVDGNPTVDFTYSAIDAAGETSLPATVTLPFSTASVLSISGNVFNDADGLTDGAVDGPGIGAVSGTPLFASLLDSNGNVVASVPVNANGTYNFDDVTANTDFTVQLSTTDETAQMGSAPSTGPELPSDWVNTGENLGTGAGDDGTANGLLSVSVATTSVTNANLGIEQPPTANDVTAPTSTNPGGTTQVPVPALDVSDPEDGTPTTITIETLPDPTTEGELFYNGTPVTAGQVIPNFDPTLLTVDPVDGNPTVDFTYTTTDAAGEESSPATVTLPFSAAPVLSISGNVFNDADGLTDGTVDGPGIGTVSGTPLFASLLDSNGNVVASVPVNANGTYNFDDVTANTDFTIQLSTTDETAQVGNAPSTGPELPSDWVNTGENLGTGAGDDGTANGLLSVSVATTSVTDANLGVEQPPTANDVTAPGQTNQVDTQFPVPPVDVSDPEDGTPTTITIETLPDPTTEGELFYNGTPVTAGQVIPNFDPTLLTVDPIDGNPTIDFTYTTTDVAGEESPPATVMLPFSAGNTTPITLGYFHAQRGVNDGEVTIHWQTVTESGNVGFNLYGKAKGEDWQKLNADLIVSPVGDSQQVQDYEYLSVGPVVTRFAIGDIDIYGKETIRGPFKLGKQHGSNRAGRTQTDWSTIRAQSAAKKAARKANREAKRAKRMKRMERKLDGQEKQMRRQLKRTQKAARRNSSAYNEGQSKPNHWSSRLLGAVLLALVPSANAAELVNPVTSPGLIYLTTDEPGIYRVTYEQLLAQGIDLGGVKHGRLSLTHRGEKVAVRTKGQDHNQSSQRVFFGPGGWLEFIADEDAAQTLYTKESVYALRNNASKRLGIKADHTNPNKIAAPLTRAYTATQTAEYDLQYSPAASVDDPWYATRTVSTSLPVTQSLPIEIDHVLAGPVTVSTDIWGGFVGNHNVSVQLNDYGVGGSTFAGFVSRTITGETTSAALVEGTNQIKVTVTNTPGQVADIIHTDKWSVTYPRKLTVDTDTDQLIFSAQAPRFQVSGYTQFVAGNVNRRVYRKGEDGTVKWLSKVWMPKDGSGRGLRFSGDSTSTTTYFVSHVDGLKQVGFVDPVEQADLLTGNAQYLVISHPDFMDSNLDQLISARQGQGYTTKVVDVEAVYTAFDHGYFGADAIQHYIAWAHANLGTQMVLLVGGDTNDYHGNLSNGSMSFIPSRYVQTSGQIYYAPSDAKYADVDGDDIPDLAIGRMIPRTTEEWSNSVSKTLQYTNHPSPGTMVFAVDEEDVAAQYSFSADADGVIAELPESWQANITRAYIDEQGLASARSTLIDALNDGQAVASMFGHSGSRDWTFSGLFRAGDAANMTNAGAPTVITQWGCWNTYYVSNSEDTLAHEFMLNDLNGAAAVLGASTLTVASHEREMAKEVYPRMFTSGKPIGVAILEAKQSRALDHSGELDVILGWNLLGDPALTVSSGG